MKMPVNKSLDDAYSIIEAILRDVYKSHVGVSDTLTSLTVRKFHKRLTSEGFGFLTKTLPSLGKALDCALAGGETFNLKNLDIDSMCKGSQVPRLLGELFERVIHADGTVRKDACVQSVRYIRQITYLFYKYELPYTYEQEIQVLETFTKNEEDLVDNVASRIRCACSDGKAGRIPGTYLDPSRILTSARNFLNRLFHGLDVQGIIPRHGPGAVANREQFSRKYEWSNIPDRLTDKYPLDAFFCASVGHVCDEYARFANISGAEPSARVVLVQKDSRGPRLISCEPVALQWIQQGLREAIYQHVEGHPLTRFNVFFTNQQPNQLGALMGSQVHTLLPDKTAIDLATLDLKEASDRVSTDLVRAIFPEPLLGALMACRSCSTVLPALSTRVGNEVRSRPEQVVQMRKYAPMGSALCFPVMAITLFALLRAAVQEYWDSVPFDGILDARMRWIGEAELDTRPPTDYLRFSDYSVRYAHRLSYEAATYGAEWRNQRVRETIDRILVYGDDIIVPRQLAKTTIAVLEFFGLKANLRKCCTSGFFRESCGVDAFKGENVTPVKLKTVWGTSPSAEEYASWIEYTNSFLRLGFHATAQYLAARLVRRYGPIPTTYNCHTNDSYPRFVDPAGCLVNDSRVVPGLDAKVCVELAKRPRTRRSETLQRVEQHVLTIVPKRLTSETNGWNKLLRYFTEQPASANYVQRRTLSERLPLAMSVHEGSSPSMSVSVYTPPRLSVLKRRWR